MNRSRYEALPQSSPTNPPILLDPILSNHPSYNYNSDTPTSAPSSHRPSITSISSRTPPPSFHSSQLAHLSNQSSDSANTPNYVSNGAGIGTTPFPLFNINHYPDSVPPSFHSRSSTPRPTPSTHTLASNISGGSGIDLWGVATTTSGGTEHDGDNDEDRNGSSRLTILENEELRRLRIEAAGAGSESQGNRQNCCVRFTDASRDMEEALVMNGHNNCCVRFSSSASASDRKRRKRKNGLLRLRLC
ncbi:hypothetical protein DID88_008082 [Monilinia fructigena]|uniref:Uncharacterized protein n=1 Tax=Monilinia fructigena TaxID=38457 RepID=A0A395J4P6_9HELO|nr:hypothetical protein DID88_008082 [Monilinia fructigena]